MEIFVPEKKSNVLHFKLRKGSLWNSVSTARSYLQVITLSPKILYRFSVKYVFHLPNILGQTVIVRISNSLPILTGLLSFLMEP